MGGKARNIFQTVLMFAAIGASGGLLGPTALQYAGWIRAAAVVYGAWAAREQRKKAEDALAKSFEDRKQILRGGTIAKSYVYGTHWVPTVVAGHRSPIAAGQPGSNLPVDDPYFWIVLALPVAHRIHSYGAIYFGETLIYPGTDSAGNVTAPQFQRFHVESKTQVGTVVNEASKRVTVTPHPGVSEPIQVLTPLQGYAIALTVHNQSPNLPTTGDDTFQDTIRPEAFASLVPGTTNVIQLNNVLVGDSYTLGFSYQYMRSHMTIRLYYGDENQPACAELIAATAQAGLFQQQWTVTDQLNGVPYIVFKCLVDPDVFPNGFENVAVAVGGKPVFEPRNGLTAYSENPITCIRDYAINECGVQAGEINLNHFWSQANICDEHIPIGGPPNLVPGYTDANPHQYRYRINCVLSTEASPLDNLGIMLSSCDGSIVPSAGTFDIRAGAYEEPIIALNESDLAGPPEVIKGLSRPDLFNGVRSRYSNWRKKYWPIDEGPAYFSPTYEAQDTYRSVREIDFPATNDVYAVHRLSKQILHRARNGLTVRALFNMVAFQLSAEQMVWLEISSLGLLGAFRIKKYKPINLYQVEMELQEDSPSLYVWSFNEAAFDPTPNSTLQIPDSRSVPTVEGLGLETALGVVGVNGEVSAVCRVFWSPVSNPYVLAGGYIKVRYRRAIDLAFTESPKLDPRQDEFRFSIKRGDWLIVQVQLANSLAKGKWKEVQKIADDAPTAPLAGNYLTNAIFEFVGQFSPPPYPFPYQFNGWSQIRSAQGNTVYMSPDHTTFPGMPGFDPNHAGMISWTPVNVIENELLEVISIGMAVVPSTRVVSYIYHWSNAGFGYMGISFLDKNGNDAGGWKQSVGVRSPPHPGGQITLADFQLDILFADVPATAATAFLVLFHYRDMSAFPIATIAKWWHPYFGAASAGQITIPSWRK